MSECKHEHWECAGFPYGDDIRVTSLYWVYCPDCDHFINLLNNEIIDDEGLIRGGSCVRDLAGDMKITKRVLDFWQDMYTRLKCEANNMIKKHLVAEGKSDRVAPNDTKSYKVDMYNGFPINILANVACHCHPEWEVIMKITKQDMIDNQEEGN